MPLGRIPVPVPHSLWYILVYTKLYLVYTGIYSVIPGIYWYIPLLYIVVYTNPLHCCVQDTIVVVPPFPYCIEEDRHDVPLEDCWYARPQLFFTCVMRPKNGRLPKDKHPASMWLRPRIWWAGSLLSHCFWLVTRLRLSLTCSASARKQASHLAVPTLLLWTDDGAAISTKSTRGCGSLGVASPALGACPSSRLGRGRMPQAMHGTSGQPRQDGLARRLMPDSK